MNAIPQPSEPLFTVHLNRHKQGELVLIALNVFERLLMQNLPQMHDRSIRTFRATIGNGGTI